MNRIAQLNDAFRTSFTGGKVMITASVQALPTDVLAHALGEVRRFNGFNEDNDPHGEHDFGSFELSGRKLLWKIDYYDENLEFGSNDPSDPSVTTRVLTIMLAADY